MEYKAGQQFIKSIEDRTVVGYFAIHGNVDDGLDRSHLGAFADYAVDGRSRVRFLWQHDFSAPPIAIINYVREVSRDELPEKVLRFAPEATGAAEVSRTYLATPRAEEVLAGIKAGAIEEMSYAYDVTKHAVTEDPRGSIRELYGMRLWDISDVNHGMNPATVGSKGLPLAIEHQTALAAVDGYITRCQQLAALRAKEGRVLSGENRTRIEQAVDALDGARTALKDLLAATEPKQAGGHADTNALRAAWARRQHALRDLGVAL